MPVERQVVILYTATNNLLADIAVEDIGRFEEGFLEYVGNMHNDIYKSIDETKDLTKENEEKIVSALDEFKNKFKAQ